MDIFCQAVDGHETDIMAVMAVFWTGIAQPDDYFLHRVARGRFPVYKSIEAAMYHAA